MNRQIDSTILIVSKNFQYKTNPVKQQNFDSKFDFARTSNLSHLQLIKIKRMVDSYERN